MLAWLRALAQDLWRGPDAAGAPAPIREWQAIVPMPPPPLLLREPRQFSYEDRQ